MCFSTVDGGIPRKGSCSSLPTGEARTSPCACHLQSRPHTSGEPWHPHLSLSAAPSLLCWANAVSYGPWPFQKQVVLTFPSLLSTSSSSFTKDRKNLNYLKTPRPFRKVACAGSKLPLPQPFRQNDIFVCTNQTLLSLFLYM